MNKDIESHNIEFLKIIKKNNQNAVNMDSNKTFVDTLQSNNILSPEIFNTPLSIVNSVRSLSSMNNDD